MVRTTNPLFNFLARFGESAAPASPPAPRPRSAPYVPPRAVYGPGAVLPEQPPAFPIGPGGVTGAGFVRAPAEEAQDARWAESVQDFGRRAGDLANSSRFTPRYSRNAPDELAMQFGGQRPPIGPGGIVSPSPSTRASTETGIPRTYLETLIEHESGGDDTAKASTSSATGPAQFIDSTWLRMMRQHGARYGLPASASDLEILGLRSNRQWAALMAAEYTHENRQTMTAALRRPITEREAYLGHFLGADDAADLIAASEARLPDARRFVSRAAVDANRSIFFRPDGRPRTAREVVELQGRDFRNATLKERDG